MQSAFARISQRYLIPQFVVSIYHFLKSRSVVSLKSQVQMTGRITFGKGTVVKPYAVIQTQSGCIAFGSNCAVSSFNHISTGTEDIVVGDNVRLAPNVTLLGGSRLFERRDTPIVDQGSFNTGLRIGNDVLIGAQVVVLPGCNIGEGAVVGAGSVVTSEVEPYSIVAGIPAREVGERS